MLIHFYLLNVLVQLINRAPENLEIFMQVLDEIFFLLFLNYFVDNDIQGQNFLVNIVNYAEIIKVQLMLLSPQ